MIRSTRDDVDNAAYSPTLPSPVRWRLSSAPSRTRLVFGVSACRSECICACTLLHLRRNFDRIPMMHGGSQLRFESDGTHTHACSLPYCAHSCGDHNRVSAQTNAALNHKGSLRARGICVSLLWWHRVHPLCVVCMLYAVGFSDKKLLLVYDSTKCIHMQGTQTPFGSKLVLVPQATVRRQNQHATLASARFSEEI